MEEVNQFQKKVQQRESLNQLNFTKKNKINKNIKINTKTNMIILKENIDF